MSNNQIYYCFHNNVVNVVTLNSASAFTTLPPAVYSLMYSDMGGYYLTMDKERFKSPEKVFGNVSNRVSHVIKRYDSQTNSLGVLLTGNKGSGKSLFTTLVSNSMIERGFPVIVINDSYSGQDMNEFLNKIGECVIIFDEFAKTYDRQEQNKLLTLFNGIMSSKRIVLVTENDKHCLNDYIINRPGRFMYHFKYEKLEEEVVNEYCDYKGVPEKIKKQIHLLRNRSAEFSMDTLVAIVSEYQMFGSEDCNVDDLVSILNISLSNESLYKLTLTHIENNKTGETQSAVRDGKLVDDMTYKIGSLSSFGFYVEHTTSGSGSRAGNLSVQPAREVESDSVDDNLEYDESWLSENTVKYSDGLKMICVRDEYTFIFSISTSVDNMWEKYININAL